MARYVTLIRFTDQGARNLKKSTDRAQAFRKAAEKSGLTVETQLWTTGSYDGVLVLSGEDEQVLEWRFEELNRAGFPDHIALELALHGLHAPPDRAPRRVFGASRTHPQSAIYTPANWRDSNALIAVVSPDTAGYSLTVGLTRA